MSELILTVKNPKNETYGWLWHGVLSCGSTGFIPWLHMSVPNSESAHRKNSYPIFFFFWQNSQCSNQEILKQYPPVSISMVSSQTSKKVDFGTLRKKPRWGNVTSSEKEEHLKSLPP